MKNIGLECQIYSSNHNGRFPATFEELLRNTDLTSDIFVCPETNDVRAPGDSVAEQADHLAVGHHLSYVYVGNGLTTSVPSPSTVVVAYEPLSNHRGAGSNFLFADGHVEWIAATAAKALIATHPATQPTSAP
ncbi:MAG TPA: H-X9-DG-CTERM domain-containing protein [Humisphaera sp.]|nr:H-X9-DG-CTERM domain-containing protein [Humisphaera sp.]